MVDKGNGNREGCQQGSQSVALLIYQVEASYRNGHQGDSGRLGDMACWNNNKEIGGEADGQRTHDAEPGIHLECPEQDEEADEIDDEDGWCGALLMSGKGDFLQGSQQGVRLVMASANLVVRHAAEHATRPKAIVACLLVILLHLLHGPFIVAGVARIDDQTLKRGSTINAGNSHKEDNGSNVCTKTV